MKECADSKAAPLSDRVSHRLAGYMAAAGAAGVGMLTLAQPAQAGTIVFTPSNASYTIGNGALGIDLNGDGIVDFNLASGSRPFQVSMRVNGASVGGNSVLGFGGSLASTLPEGAPIAPGGNFLNANQATATYSNVGLQMVVRAQTRSGRYYIGGPWAYAEDAFLGLRFTVDGQAYYGWIGFTEVEGTTAQLFGYAYDTVPDEPLNAGQVPEPGTLSLLALERSVSASGGAGSPPTNRHTQTRLLLRHPAI